MPHKTRVVRFNWKSNLLKMAAKEQDLPRLFTQLQTAGNDGDFDKCLKFIDKILSLAPGDKDALCFKITCLIHLSKFEEALNLIDKCPECVFEKAYCLYRLEKYQECSRVLDRLPSADVKVQELCAQILYRQEQYIEAATLYSRLVQEGSDDYSNDREANYIASVSFTCSKAVCSLTTMEQCFNTACCLMNNGQPQQALDMLSRAQDLCRASLLEEGYSEEEIEEELAIINVQRGYVLQVLGRAKEALDQYNSVLKMKVDDSALTVVACNNVIALNKDRDVFDSKKKIKVLASEGSLKRLTRTQKMAILYNRSLFALQTNQIEQSKALVKDLSSVYPSTDKYVLAQVALLCRERKIAAATELLQTHLRSQPSSDITLHLTLTQLLQQQGQQEKVVSGLRSFKDLSRYPGAVATLVSLYTSRKDVSSASKVLDSAVAYWEPNGGTKYQQLMLENAKYKLSHGDPQNAASVLEVLHRKQPKDVRVTALLVSAYSRYNPKLAEDLSRSLEGTTHVRTLDIDALEQMPTFRLSRRQAQKPAADNLKTDKAVVKQSKKKKRKPRLPKNMDLSAPIDKERWLPLRERSYFKRGKRKGFIGSLRGSQGTTTASASLMAQLDASKPSIDSGAKVEPTSPKGKPTTQAQKKKPKKKKGKW